MSNHKKREKFENFENKEEKIQFGKKMIRCFACGQKIEYATIKCPYCGTKLDTNISNHS
jgi:DNA-directed RNA polymerase subunit RPC12/RpoP